MDTSIDCISCGMPMETIEDHAANDVSKNYCVHCAKPDGTMKTYEETLAGLTKFIMDNEGLNEIEAKSLAREMMAKLPAWEGRSDN